MKNGNVPVLTIKYTTKNEYITHHTSIYYMLQKFSKY